MRVKSRPVLARLHRSGFEGEGIAGNIWIESADGVEEGFGRTSWWVCEVGRECSRGR
jgi:hypothetical protein